MTQYKFDYSDCMLVGLLKQLAQCVVLTLEISYLHNPDKSNNISKYSLNFTAICNNKMTNKNKITDYKKHSNNHTLQIQCEILFSSRTGRTSSVKQVKNFKWKYPEYFSEIVFMASFQKLSFPNV